MKPVLSHFGVMLTVLIGVAVVLIHHEFGLLVLLSLEGQ
jgi:hypothetical protein